MDGTAKPQATVEMFSFATQQLETVARFPGVRVRRLFRVTRDGSSMLYQRFDRWSQRHRDLPEFVEDGPIRTAEWSSQD